MRLSDFSSSPSTLGFIGAELHLTHSQVSPAPVGGSSDPDAVLALVGIGLRAPPPPPFVDALHRALADWARGDKALANIRLAQAPLPPAPDDAANRIKLARGLIADGFTPHDLLKALDLDPERYGLRKYDPDQPRVPGGSSEGGRWTRGGGSGAAAAGDAAAAATTAGALMVGRSAAVGVTTAPVDLGTATTAARGLFAEFAESAIPELLTLATRFAGPAALLGALVVPDANDGGVTSGDVPGQLGVKYNLDGPAGRLTLTMPGADGKPLSIVTGNAHGAYVDANGRKVGVALGGGFVLDQTALAAAFADQALTAGRAVPQVLTAPGGAGAVVSERRTARSPGGGAGSPRARCLRAAEGSEDDWLDFCNTIPSREKNNVVGEGWAVEACRRKTFSSPTEKRNWCLNQYGTR